MKTKQIIHSLILAILLIGAVITSDAAYAQDVIVPEYSTADYGDLFANELDAIDELKKPCSEQGNIVSLTYTAPAYAVNELLEKDETREKTLQVYLPFGYDETKQYNILYLLHDAALD